MNSNTCTDCGKAFVPTAHTPGYAVLPNGSRICYACADERQRADLLDRSKPFTGYLSGDGCRFTTWTGGTLGSVVRHNVSRTAWHGAEMHHVRVVDVHGNAWFGKGAGQGMALTVRPCKRKPHEFSSHNPATRRGPNA